MNGGNSELTIVVTARDAASAVLKQIQATVANTAGGLTSLGDNLEKAGRQLSGLGGALMPFSLGAGAMLATATKQAVDFQQNMELLHTQAGLTQRQVDQLNGSILQMAPLVGQGPSQLAEAFYHIASAGNGIWNTAQMLDILKVAAEGAAVGQANLDDTTYALSSAWASGVKGAKDITQMMGVLNAIVGAGDMRFQDLNAAISTGFLSTSATFGVSLQSMGTALATLTDNGEHADEAATRLRMTLALMAAPSAKAAKLLSAIGLQGPEIKASTDAMTQALQDAGLTTLKLSDDLRQPNGIMVALKDLKDHLESAGLSADAANALLSKAFGGGRTDAAMLTLLQNLDRMDEKFKIINASTNTFGDSWAAQQETAKQKLADFRAELDVAEVKLGNAFLPTLQRVTANLANLADWFGQLSPQTQDLIVKTLLFTAALGPLLKLMGTGMTVVGGFTKLVGGLVGTLGRIGGSAGLAVAAGEAEASVGGLAAVLTGPVGLAVAGAAVAIGGLWAGYKLLTRSTQEQTNSNNDQAGSVSMLTLFQQAQKKAQDDVKQSQVALKQSQTDLKQSNQELSDKYRAVQSAQADVKKALDTYGANSPQYKQATDNLTTAELAYRDAVHDASNKTLDLMVNQGKLKDAQKALTDASAILNTFLKDQNKSLGDINLTIAQMGPTSLLQVKSIATLGENIQAVVTRFRNAQGELQAGIASDIGNFQGLGSTIGRLQDAAKNLQVTVSNTKLQGGSAGSLQGNYGTAPVPGVYQPHAAGGVFTSPHVGLVAEDGPEAIVPLSKPKRAAQVMKDAGIGGTVINVTNHIHSDVDLDRFVQSLGWRLANA